MKKIYFLLVAIVVTSFSFAQTTLALQDFEGIVTDTWTYTETPTTYTASGDIWSVVSSLSSITPQSGANFWGMQDLNNPNGGGNFDHTLAFSNINVAGESNVVLTFNYYTIGYDSTDTIRVEYFFDDVSQGETTLDKNTDAWAFVSKVVPPGTTNVRLTLLAFQNSGSDYAAFDNIMLQSGANTNPTLTIDSPMSGTTINVGSSGFDTTLTIQNFTVSGDVGGGVSDNSGDGFIKYTLDSNASISKFDTAATNFVGLADGSHTLYYELVDNSGNPLASPVNDSVTFTTNSIIQTLPFYDGFNYTVADNLVGQVIWQGVNTGDEIIVAAGGLSYTGLEAPTGNSINFAGSGKDAKIEFAPVTSGTVFASFIFKVTDQSSMTDVTDGGYFVFFSKAGTYSFKARVWAHPNPNTSGTTFDIGFGNASSTPPTTPNTFNVGGEIFVVTSYELTTGTTNVWINPASADLGGTAPTVTLTETDGSPETELNQFNIRQDSTGETPSITFDELRIGTTWADVTPSATASIAQNEIKGFAIYPNPVNNGEFNIKSLMNIERQVQLFDILGKTVYSNMVQANETVKVANLNAGIYIIKVTEEGKVATRKLVIQ